MNLNVKGKLLTLVLLPLLLVTLLINLTFYINGSKGVEAQLLAFRQQLLETKQIELDSYISIAKTSIDSLYKTDLDGENKQRALAIINHMRFAKDGYFFIYDSHGVNVMHPVKPELQGKNLINAKDKNGVRFIAGIIEAGKSGDGFHTYHYFKPSINDIAPKLAYSIYLPKWDWIIGTGIYIDDIDLVLQQYADTRYAELLQDTWVSIMIACLVVILTTLLLSYFISRGVNPLLSMVDKLDDIASGDGDLTERLSARGNDEIAQLAIAFNRFMDKLQPLIRQLQHTAIDVQNDAKQLDSMTSESSQMIQEHSIETEKVVTAVTEMAATSREVANNTVSTATSIDLADQQLSEAEQEVEDSITGINELVSEINLTSDAIQSLSVQTEKITGVLDVIGAIAEQTNLLALNAAIEAARAGTQGRGFAVVADEVRSLASRTQNSTEEINQMLTALQSGVRVAVTTMEASQKHGEKTVREAASIKVRLAEINRAVADIQNRGHQTASAAEEQSVVAEEINQNLVAIQQLVERLNQDILASDGIASSLSHSGQAFSEQVGQFRV